MSLARRATTAVAVLAALTAAAPTALATPVTPAVPTGLATPIAPVAPTAPVAHGRPHWGAGLHGPTSLVLSVTTAPRAAVPVAQRRVTLHCDPAGGLHPHAGEACSELAAANGGFDRIETTREMCPMVFAPVTATATGSWQGHAVSWSHEFANSCVLTQHTGVLFSF